MSQSKKEDENLKIITQIAAWQCPSCTFKNYPTISACEICNTQNPSSSKISDIEKKENFQCHACQFLLSTIVSTCPNCEQVLIPEQDEVSEKDPSKIFSDKKMSQRKLKNCHGCGQENDILNEQCVFCEQNLSQKLPSASGEIPIKKRGRIIKPFSRAPRGFVPGVTCPHCKMNIYGTTLQVHQLSCPAGMKGEKLEIRFLEVEKELCFFCYEKFKYSEYDKHERNCTQRKQFYSKQNQTYLRCTKLQIQTMHYMHQKSEKLHWIAQAALKNRITSLGYKASELENLHHYLVNYAPIIIHMHADQHMQFFVKDTHYRNQFETKKSSGSLSQTSRISWEDRMFDNQHHNATPFQRVKYGTINFTNDPKGVMACLSYGQSYFLLKSHVRNRCTLTDMDSSSPSATIATFQFCYHLLNKLPDVELKGAFEGSKANQVASSMIGSYKQIQIHGPVEFKKDIERVYISKKQLKDPSVLKIVQQFCKKNGLEYQILDPLFKQPDATGAVDFGGLGVGGFGSFGFGLSSFPAVTGPSIFSAPAMSPSTAHLFGTGRRGPRGRRRVQIEQGRQEKKEKKQGVDYI